MIFVQVILVVLIVVSVLTFIAALGNLRHWWEMSPVLRALSMSVALLAMTFAVVMVVSLMIVGGLD